jgi:hypothetical protein
MVETIKQTPYIVKLACNKMDNMGQEIRNISEAIDNVQGNIKSISGSANLLVEKM